MEVLTHVETKIETIQFDKRIDADPFLLYDLQCFKADNGSVTPPDKHDTLSAASNGVPNHACQRFRVVELLAGIKINGVVAAGFEVIRHPFKVPQSCKIAIRADEDDERFLATCASDISTSCVSAPNAATSNVVAARKWQPFRPCVPAQRHATMCLSTRQLAQRRRLTGRRRCGQHQD